MKKIFWIVSVIMLSNASVEAKPYSFLKSAKEIQTTCDQEIRAVEVAIEKLTQIQSPTFENTVQELEFTLDQFRTQSNLLVFVSYVSDQKDLREASNQCKVSIEKTTIDIFSNEALFAQFETIASSKAYKKLKDHHKLLFDEYYQGFVANGLHIEDADKKTKIKELNKEIADLASEYQKNTVEKTKTMLVDKEDLKGLDQGYIDGLKKEKDQYLLTTDYPVYIPLMEKAENEKLRKQMNTLFGQRGGKENVEIFETILQKRRELAHLMGYKNHAQKIMDLNIRMAKDVNEIEKFLKDLQEDLRPLHTRDLDHLKNLKCKETKCKNKDEVEIQEWDFSYYIHQMKKELGDLDFAKVKEYFPLDTVTQGMFEIYQTLLGLTFKKVKDFDTWADAPIELFEVWDTKTATLLGHFYIDLFPREGKYKHAAAFNMIKPKLMSDGSFRKTMSAMVCNFNPPTKDRPSLLTHSEVNTYFHEFGHIMHGVVSQTEYPSQGGTSVPRDFVEAPSQMLENWVWQPETLAMLSGHYETGKKLPKDMLEQLIALKNVASGLTETRQLFFGTIDLTFHSLEEQSTIDTTAVWNDLTRQIMGIVPNPETYRQASFGHLVGGYDVGYYGYMWSRVYAQDMFSVFEKKGILNSKIGLRYRKTILEKGKSEDTAKLIRQFLKRKPSNKAFVQSLGL